MALRGLAFVEAGAFRTSNHLRQAAATSAPGYRPENGNLKVAQSQIPGAGLGLYTKTPILKGATICDYTGTPRSDTELLTEDIDTSYVMGLSSGRHIDARGHFHSFGRYVNDNDDGPSINAMFVRRPEEMKALVQATRDIKAGEEIFAAYGSIYWLKRGLRPGMFQSPNRYEEKGNRGRKAWIPSPPRSYSFWPAVIFAATLGVALSSVSWPSRS
mmetsp:Transcript_15521/g.30351  ORF Transcript_15521/g.30351 Transcript_15521/m.30351 type:complete len:215 (-) Transcript_15521:255-899(-)